MLSCRIMVFEASGGNEARLAQRPACELLRSAGKLSRRTFGDLPAGNALDLDGCGHIAIGIERDLC
jgi:hypothetical protein